MSTRDKATLVQEDDRDECTAKGAGMDTTAPDDTPDRVRGLWEALAYLENEAKDVGGMEVSFMISVAREALERRWGGTPPPEPGHDGRIH